MFYTFWLSQYCNIYWWLKKSKALKIPQAVRKSIHIYDVCTNCLS
ncbi:hypothetical protein MTBPR1_10002 [Candidatus Terasakiella magnetica]|uniref:Uncharacterized protein n=1 Tax=Candidatus Terasakiella magnetica TaxID=1867952 RepID=A0A1C3RBW8_9PROT|nr:hypothetical protein MTBPR1_10002 [Candidatus Terasakiella magnetica]